MDLVVLVDVGLCFDVGAFFNVAELVPVDIDNAVVAWTAEVQKSEVIPQRPDEEHC